MVENRLKEETDVATDAKLVADDAKEVDENFKFGEGKAFEDSVKPANAEEAIPCNTGEIKISSSTFEPVPKIDPKSSPSSQSPPLNMTPPSEPPVPPKYTTAMATMWLGAQSGMLYIHSAIGEWNVCLGR